MPGMDCLFPENAPRTAYRKGCRCDRCRMVIRAQRAKYYDAHRGLEIERSRQYYDAHRSAVLTRQAAHRADNTEPG